MKIAMFLKSSLGAVFIAVASMMSVTSARTVSREEREHLTDSLNLCLSRAGNTADSLRIMYDLYDLSNVSENIENSLALYDVASRLRDDKAQLEMLRNVASMAATIHDEELAQWALAQTKSIPDSEDKRQSEVFIKACITGSHKFRSAIERDQYMNHLISRFIANNTPDEYRRAAQLFALLYMVSEETQGSMVDRYADELRQLITDLPDLPVNYLENKFNTMAAIAYWHNNMPEDALEADRRQLESFDEMQQYHEQKGRPYRNYDLQRFVSITRMLMNFEALTVQEVDSLQLKALELANIYPALMQRYNHTPTIQVAKLLKDGNYAEALPMVKLLADSVTSMDEKIHYTKLLIEVAEEVGATDIAREARLANSKLLEEYESSGNDDKMKELQMLYDASVQQQRLAEDARHRQDRRNLELTILTIALVLLLFVFVVLYIRFRSLSKKLYKANKELKAERKSLMKTQEKLVAARDKVREADAEKMQTINYLGHELLIPINAISEYSHLILDTLSDEQRQYMANFVNIVSSNIRIIQALALDVQEFAIAENFQLSTMLSACNANDIAETAFESVRFASKHGVEMRWQPCDDPSPIIVTDTRRVEAVLLSLLSNAIKFTDRGSVTLSVALDRPANKAVFTVTDTGIGIPADKVESLFDGMDHAENDPIGIGSGLHNCRTIATALNGEIKLDATHTGPGAKFILTIPINQA